MQEEVENRTVVLAIRTAQLTGNVLKAAIARYLAYLRDNNRDEASVRPAGKQTVKELIGQNQGVSGIEITDDNIRGFDRVARKYGVDYAVKKDSSGERPRFLVFFKGRDADALTAAFTEYTNSMRHKKERQPEIDMISNRGFQSKDISRTRRKEKELSL